MNTLADFNARVAQIVKDSAGDLSLTVESGTADAGGGDNELIDATKSWTTNAWTNYHVRVIHGTGIGQHRLISSNTATKLVVSTNWITNPDTTSEYEIYIDEIDDYVQAALKRYSHHKPQSLAHEFQGDGGYDYSLPDDWIQGFSRITQVEYPYDQQRPNIIPHEEWTLFLKLMNSTQTFVLRFLAISPVAGEYVRITYTIPHVVDDSSSTVFDNDFDAVCCLAASYCCGALSRKYSQTSDPTIAADVVNYAAKASSYASRAKELFQAYLDQLGLTEVPASVGTKEFDTGFVWGAEYLSHKSWHR
ncbi:hypothetical protein ES703_60712 [subsurface metagenome]